MYSYTVKGRFKWDLVNEESGEIAQSGGKDNLILNQGIDYCFQRSFAENINACALSSLYLPPIKSDTTLDGEFLRTTQVDTTSANETGTEVSSADAGGGYIYPVGTVTHTKTYRFPTFTQRTAIGTIGISPSATTGANLFAKSVIGPDIIYATRGQYLRLTYSLSITYPSSYDQAIPVTAPDFSALGYLGNFGPTNIQVAPTYLTQSGAWGISGWQSTQLIGLMAMNSNGTVSPIAEARTGAINMVTGFRTGASGPNVILIPLSGTPTGIFLGQGCNEPASGGFIFLSRNAQSPNITSCSIDRTASSSVKTGMSVTYLGNGLGYKSATFGRGVAITGVYSWGLGGATQPEKNCGYVCVATGAAYVSGSLPTGVAGNGYMGLTKLPTAELTLQFFYNVSSL